MDLLFHAVMSSASCRSYTAVLSDMLMPEEDSVENMRRTIRGILMFILLMQSVFQTLTEYLSPGQRMANILNYSIKQFSFV